MGTSGPSYCVCHTSSHLVSLPWIPCIVCSLVCYTACALPVHIRCIVRRPQLMRMHTGAGAGHAKDFWFRILNYYPDTSKVHDVQCSARAGSHNVCALSCLGGCALRMRDAIDGMPVEVLSMCISMSHVQVFGYIEWLLHKVSMPKDHGRMMLKASQRLTKLTAKEWITWTVVLSQAVMRQIPMPHGVEKEVTHARGEGEARPRCVAIGLSLTAWPA
jgi:hypothetical protein